MADIVTEAMARWVPDDHPGRRGQIGQDVKDLCAEITRLNEEVERLRAALKEIATISERPASQYPADWKEQIAGCSECQRYKDHPVQRGICDTHRKPIYAQERYDAHETRILGIRAKDIARAALTKEESDG